MQEAREEAALDVRAGGGYMWTAIGIGAWLIVVIGICAFMGINKGDDGDHYKEEEA